MTQETNTLAKQKIAYRNPILEQRADPWIYKHTDGFYYYTASVPAFDLIELRRSETIQGIQTAEPVVAWRKHASGEMSANIWAPEIHFIQGKWYIYFAAARASGSDNGLYDHRMYVLENEAANPLTGTWVEKGQVVTDWESFSLDATQFEHKGKHYLVWAQRDLQIEGNSNLYIAELENPWTIKRPQVMLTKPEFEWERIGFKVNEGAAVLKKNGKLFMTYSGSATDHNYCMGMLTADEDSDVLDPTSWIKGTEPVFSSDYEAGQYGPGHNSFTVAEDDVTDVLVYHARNYMDLSAVEGQSDPAGLADPNRHTRAQAFSWNEDGTPNFGRPVPDSK